MIPPDNRSSARVYPTDGVYRVTSTAADGSATYPDNGRGAKITTAGNAHWTDMGFSSGEFWVEVTHVTVASGGFLTLVENEDATTSQIFPAGTHPMRPGLRMKGGFSFNTSGGGTILYRIHAVHQPPTS